MRLSVCRIGDADVAAALQTRAFAFPANDLAAMRRTKIGRGAFYAASGIGALALCLWIRTWEVKYAWAGVLAFGILTPVCLIAAFAILLGRTHYVANAPDELAKKFYGSLYESTFLPPAYDAAYALLAPTARQRSGCRSFDEFKQGWLQHVRNVEGGVPTADPVTHSYEVADCQASQRRGNERVADIMCTIKVSAKSSKGNIDTHYRPFAIVHHTVAARFDDGWRLLCGEPGQSPAPDV